VIGQRLVLVELTLTSMAFIWAWPWPQNSEQAISYSPADGARNSTVIRSDDEPHGLAGRDLYRGGFVCKPARDDLHVMNTSVGGGQVTREQHRANNHHADPGVRCPAPNAHPTTTCPVILGWIEQ
jgi:hypothetical protein